MSYTYFTTVSNDYNMDDGGSIGFSTYLIDCSGGSITLSLTSSPWEGLTFCFMRTDNNVLNSLTINSNGDTHTINGETSKTLLINNCAKVLFTGSEWFMCLNSITI